MARVKIAYLGGGSSRAPGTMASFIHHGAEFDGSEFVLIDLDPDHLEITRRMATRMVQAAGLDITVTATTDMRRGLADVDAVLSSFRPAAVSPRLERLRPCWPSALLTRVEEDCLLRRIQFNG